MMMMAAGKSRLSTLTPVVVGFLVLFVIMHQSSIFCSTPSLVHQVDRHSFRDRQLLSSLDTTTGTGRDDKLNDPESYDEEESPRRRRSRNGGKIDYSERVAICICGTMRTFHYDAVHETILQYMIQPLRDRYQTDVYFIVKMEDDVAPTRLKAERSDERGRAAIAKFKPKKVIEFERMDEENDMGLNLTRYREKDGGTPVRMINPHNCSNLQGHLKHLDFSHTLFRTKQCLVEVSKVEKAEGFKYSWLYRTRTDVVVLQNISLPYMLKRTEFYVSQWNSLDSSVFDGWWRYRHNTAYAGNGPLGDHMFVAHRNLAERGFRAFDIVDDCEAYELPAPNIEGTLKMYFVKNRIRYHPKPWFFVVIRDRYGPQCWDVRYIQHPLYDLNELTRRCNNFTAINNGSLPTRGGR